MNALQAKVGEKGMPKGSGAQMAKEQIDEESISGDSHSIEHNKKLLSMKNRKPAKSMLNMPNTDNI